MTTPSTRPVTRDEKENSKKEFDDLIFLINQELRGIEGWLLNTTKKKLNNRVLLDLSMKCMRL